MRFSITPILAAIPLRLLGLFLLSLAIVIPGCQAVFARDAGEQTTFSPRILQ